MMTLPFLLLLASACHCNAFSPAPVLTRSLPAVSAAARTSTLSFVRSNITPVQRIRSSTTLSSTASPIDVRRRELLGRKGPFFALDRQTGKIEFGATARYVTQLYNDNKDGTSNNAEKIADWLREEQSFAMSIWQEDLIEQRGDNVYRLQLMTLQFVTLRLSPWVDLRMKTVQDSKGNPVFTLQSVAFDPNVELMPGMRVSAESLGIVIEVAGQLRASADGKGVTGSIAFQTTGNLPGPLRILPDAVLKAASDTINETVVNFAVQSFQKGAIANFQKYLLKPGQKVAL